jgi:hypothetical protein
MHLDGVNGGWILTPHTRQIGRRRARNTTQQRCDRALVTSAVAVPVRWTVAMTITPLARPLHRGTPRVVSGVRAVR